eukprot:g6339.t1
MLAESQTNTVNFKTGAPARALPARGCGESGAGSMEAALAAGTRQGQAGGEAARPTRAEPRPEERLTEEEEEAARDIRHVRALGHGVGGLGAGPGIGAGKAAELLLLLRNTDKPRSKPGYTGSELSSEAGTQRGRAQGSGPGGATGNPNKSYKLG